MARNIRSVARKRRHTRVRKQISGSPDCPRLNVYRSIGQIYAQLIDDLSGNTLVSASSIDLELRSKMKGLNKTDQARTIGEAIAERAKKAGYKKVVFDRGGFRYSGRVKALAEGARKGGLEF